MAAAGSTFPMIAWEEWESEGTVEESPEVENGYRPLPETGSQH